MFKYLFVNGSEFVGEIIPLEAWNPKEQELVKAMPAGIGDVLVFRNHNDVSRVYMKSVLIGVCNCQPSETKVTKRSQYSGGYSGD